MPFITSEARRMTDTIGPRVVGDRCFLAYREMVRRWRASPRWTTAHEIYEGVIQARERRDLTDPLLRPSLADLAATELAWQVFFIKHVWPYEQMKCTENGEVDF